MAERLVYDCDSCGGRAVQVLRIGVVTARQTDAAGSVDDVQETVDLCSPCAATAIQQLVQALSFADRQAWLSAIRRRA